LFKDRDTNVEIIWYLAMFILIYVYITAWNNTIVIRR
jgi:hypothetical protein